MPSRSDIESVSLRIEKLKKELGSYMDAAKHIIVEEDFLDYDNIRFYLSKNLIERMQIEFTKKRLINNEYEIHRNFNLF